MHGLVSQLRMRGSHSRVGMSTREILYKFKWRTLILFKALLLEKRVKATIDTAHDRFSFMGQKPNYCVPCNFLYYL